MKTKIQKLDEWALSLGYPDVHLSVGLVLHRDIYTETSPSEAIKEGLTIVGILDENDKFHPVPDFEDDVQPETNADL